MIHKNIIRVCYLAMIPMLCITGTGSQSACGNTDTGYFIEQDSVVATRQPGPHDGGGQTTGFSFFKNIRSSNLIFKKRILHPGSAIGYHLQEDEEIYYILSGRGKLVMNDKEYMVESGTAILTLPGTHHSLTQTGDQDLVIFIVYNRH